MLLFENNIDKHFDTSKAVNVCHQYFSDGTCLYSGGSVTVGNVLKFMTGCSTIPPGGFETKFSIQFMEERRYPSVSTCTFTIKLPLNLHEYKCFKEVMIEAIVSGAGFGNV